MLALIDCSALEVVTNAETRRERVNGREYLVAPVSLLVPGVLSGSKGALFYPPDEIARNADAWEGMPLTLGHPYLNGQPVSAKHPGVKRVGTVRAPSVRNGSLRAEGWFDVEAVGRADAALLRSLERGDRIEVSTGLYTTNEPAPPGASHNGRQYDFIARDYRPDHLAILPDEVGACSVRDGCGVHVNNLSSACCDECSSTPKESDMSLNDREREPMPTLNLLDFSEDGLPVRRDDDDERLPTGRQPTAEEMLTANRERQGWLTDDGVNALLFGANFAR